VLLHLFLFLRRSRHVGFSLVRKIEKFLEISTRPTRPLPAIAVLQIPSCSLQRLPHRFSSRAPFFFSDLSSLVKTMAILQCVAQVCLPQSRSIRSLLRITSLCARIVPERTSYSTGAPLPYPGKSGAPGRIRAVQIRQTIDQMAC
jgi:hypothetical protein